MQNAVLGLILLIIAGGMNGSFTLPMKYTRRWAWENTWLAWTIFALFRAAARSDVHPAAAGEPSLCGVELDSDLDRRGMRRGLGNLTSFLRTRRRIRGNRAGVFRDSWNRCGSGKFAIAPWRSSR